MRPLEYGIPLLLIVYLIVPYPRSFIVRVLPAGTLFLSLIHFAIEGYRWQMIPILNLSPPL
jgi:hypothetical protein